jgi:hypothetical protein
MKKSIYMCKVLLICVLCLCGCTPGSDTVTENNIHYLHLPASGEDELKVSYFADTVIYIPLETTTESFLNGIGKLWINDSLILITSRKIGIMQFRKDGRFVRKIGKIGKGPGEYMYAFSFSVVNDTVYIPNNRNGLVKYTLNGKYCGDVRLNYNPIYISSTVDQKLACYHQNEGEVLIYHSGFRAADTILVEYGVTEGRYYAEQMDFSEKPHLYKTSSGLLFNSYRNDTIWKIEGDIKTPSYILETKVKMLPYDKQIEFFVDELDKWGEIIQEYSYFHLIPFPSLNIVFQRHWSTYFANYQAIYIDNTQSGDVTKFNTSYILDDMVSNQKLISNPRTVIHTACSEDYLVASISPIEVLDYLEQNKANNKDIPSDLWVNQMKSIKADSNPILILIKIKK